jgi:hypothetical protein
MIEVMQLNFLPSDMQVLSSIHPNFFLMLELEEVKSYSHSMAVEAYGVVRG